MAFKDYAAKEGAAVQVLFNALYDAKLYDGEIKAALLTLSSATGELSGYRFIDTLNKAAK